MPIVLSLATHEPYFRLPEDVFANNTKPTALPRVWHATKADSIGLGARVQYSRLNPRVSPVENRTITSWARTNEYSSRQRALIILQNHPTAPNQSSPSWRHGRCRWRAGSWFNHGINEWRCESNRWQSGGGDSRRFYRGSEQEDIVKWVCSCLYWFFDWSCPGNHKERYYRHKFGVELSGPMPERVNSLQLSGHSILILTGD